MEHMDITNKIIEMAKKSKKVIVLPESEDLRILEATSIITCENICKIILIGNKKRILENCIKNGIDLSNENIQIINPVDYPETKTFIQKLYEIRKHRGLTIEKAEETILNNYIFFATMLVETGIADGLVCGAVTKTSDTLRPALQIIKTKPGLNTASSFFLIKTPNKELGNSGLFIFSDCGMVEFPNIEQLVDITNSSAESFKMLIGENPRVALLSYSTKGSAESEAVKKIENVLKILKEQNVSYVVDGELQLDAAIIPEVAKLKAPNSLIQGDANILIFPDIQSGNIGYKLVQRFGNAVALGPITQGLKKPVNDLSRGCNVEDIIGVVSITCIQASNSEN